MVNICFDVEFVLELVDQISKGQLEFFDTLDALPPDVEGTEFLEIDVDVEPGIEFDAELVGIVEIEKFKFSLNPLLWIRSLLSNTSKSLVVVTFNFTLSQIINLAFFDEFNSSTKTDK